MMDKSTKYRKIIETGDGSHSIYVPQLDENYHSSHGAVQEAMHIFIKEALSVKSSELESLDVLELGFGTGLNAFLSYQFAKMNKKPVRYLGIEKYPLIEREYSMLNYSSYNEKDSSVDFLDLHTSPWEHNVELDEYYSLLKRKVDFRQMLLPVDKFDVVYFDAFGPEIQPELWSESVFKLIYNSMKNGGVMTTYSVKGSVRRTMKSVGFDVKKIPGPPGKREITRAVKLSY